MNYSLVAIEVKVLRKIYFKEVHSLPKTSKACLFSLAQDFNRASTHSLSLLGLQNIVTFNTRLHSKLDHLFVNCKDMFKARKRAPLSTSDHNIICALPCIYSHTNRCQFIRFSLRTVHSRNVSSSDMLNLSTMLEQTDFSQTLWPVC